MRTSHEQRAQSRAVHLTAPPEARTRLHLVEVGLAWPPDTFLQWKLEGLVRRGFRVTVVSFFRHGPPFSIGGVDVLHLPDPKVPDPGQSLTPLALRLARDGLALGLRHPRRLLAVLAGFAQPSRRAPERAALRYRPSPRAKLREELRWLRVLLRLASMRPDIAHFEWESTATAYLPLADAWRCPIVMSCHGGLQAYGASAAYRGVLELLSAAFERAAVVQCVSAVERREAIRRGLEPGKARLMPCGVDPGRFTPAKAATPDGAPMRLVAVGWLRWIKGYEYALQTVRALLDAGVPARLDVFGGDPLPPMREDGDRARILHTISDLRLDDHVRLRGHVSTDVLVDHLRSAHAFLHSSLSEGLPVTILEAMACGLPVVATDCGGIGEAVRDGVEGFVLPPRDPLRAAGALERLWREPDLRAKMGRAGRARVVSRFTLEAHLNSMEMVYREAATLSAIPADARPPRQSP